MLIRRLMCLVSVLLCLCCMAGAEEAPNAETLVSAPTATPTLTHTSTATPTPSPKPTATPTPTPRPTSTLMPTGTPDPVLYPNLRGVFDEVEGESQKIILSFIGDTTIGCNENDHDSRKAIDAFVNFYGFQYPFQRVSYILEQDDLTIANFEGVLHDNPKDIKKKTYNFRADPSYVNILREGSIEAVTLANNHSGDYGQTGFESTAEILDENGIGWFASTDYSAKSYIYEKNGVKIGFVGAYVSYYWKNVEAIKALFAELENEGCALTIAVIHGGVEYDARHDKNQTKMATRFIEYGADIVVGHHPHRLQGYEVINGVPVFFSLGNFVFGGNFKMKSKYTAILQFALSFDENNEYMGYQINIIPCRLSSSETVNYYQPFTINGRQAELAIKEIQSDTKRKLYPILDYQEGIGALQPYVVVTHEEETQEENASK